MSLFINPGHPSTKLALAVHVLTMSDFLFSQAASVPSPASIHLYVVLPHPCLMLLPSHFIFALLSSVGALILLHPFHMRSSFGCLTFSSHRFIISSTLTRPLVTIELLFVVLESSLVDLVVQDLIVLVNFGYVSRVLNFFLVPLSYDSIALTKQLLS